MAGIRFTVEQQESLLKNRYVTKVTEKAITYSEDFKIHAVSEYVKEKSLSQIFKDAELDPNIIGTKNPKLSLQRWRTIYFREGKEGLKGQKRGRNSSGRAKTSEMTLEERLIAAEAKIAYLQMENEF